MQRTARCNLRIGAPVNARDADAAAAYRQFAALGLTQAEAARAHGVSAAAVCLYAKRHGIRFARVVRKGKPIGVRPDRSKMTPAQVADLEAIRRKGFLMCEALEMIGATA